MNSTLNISACAFKNMPPDVSQKVINKLADIHWKWKIKPYMKRNKHLGKAPGRYMPRQVRDCLRAEMAKIVQGLVEAGEPITLEGIYARNLQDLNELGLA